MNGTNIYIYQISLDFIIFSIPSKIMPESFSIPKTVHTLSTDGTIERRSSTKDAGAVNQQSSSNQEMITCRICLEEESRNRPTQTFIKPCSCSGSLQFIHQSCMIEWLNTMIKHKLEAQQPVEVIHCQICKQVIDIEFTQKRICRTKEQIKYVISLYRPYFILCVCSFVFTLGCLAVLLYLEFTTQSKTKGQKQNMRVVLIVGYVVVTLCQAFWVYKITTVYLIYKLTVIQNILSKREVRINPPKGIEDQSEWKQKGSQKRVKQLKIKQKIRIIRVEPQIDYRSASGENLEGRNNQTM